MIDKLSGYWDYNFTTQADCQTLACYPAFGFWFDPTTNTIAAWNAYLGLTSTGDAAADIQNIAVEVHKRRIRNALTADPNRPPAIYLATTDIGNDCSSVGVPNHYLSEINTRDIAMYAYEQGVRTFLFFDNIEAPLSPRAQSEILRLGHWLEDMHATPDDLGALPVLQSASVGKSVNNDGSVIVGASGVASATGSSHAFRWSPTEGMQDLGVLPGTTSSSASGVNGDGTVIVGTSFNWGTAESSAFLWTAAAGMIDLNTYLPAYRVDLTGWQLTEATAVSPDGVVIVGNGIHNGRVEGWIATLPHCHSADFNRDGSVGTDADLEDFFSCLAGNCCPACDTVDMNNDGDVGTDADIEAFFRVLGGGSC
jgi:probable HAF family extracellular repeat protein